MFGFGRTKIKTPAVDYKKLIMEGALILDVRTPAEYVADHVHGAINIPLDQINNGAIKLKNSQKKIIAYCQSGRRSGIAVDRLKMLGLDAFNAGGLRTMKRIVASTK